MVILIDNYDSFSYNLLDYSLQCGLEVKLFRDDETDIGKLRMLQPKGFIFSPGPKSPKDHPIMQHIITEYFEQVPILGICLGYQAIGEFFGAKLVKAPQPAHGKIAEIEHNNHSMFNHIPSNIKVTRYHSLIIEGLEQTDFEKTSETKDGLAMSAAHKKLPVWGMQFHPEAHLTEYGLQMMRNWAEYLH